MVQWLIYKHTSLKSGKSYIGMTCVGMERRWKQHCSSAGITGYHFHNAINLYGVEAWHHSVLAASIPTIEEAKAAEIKYIKEHDTYNNGYNSTLGGDSSKGVYPFKNMSKEEYTKYCKDMTNNQRKLHNSVKVSLFNTRTKETISGYRGDIEKELTFSSGALSSLCSGSSRSYKGWVIDTEENRKYRPGAKYWFVHRVLGTDYCSIYELARKYDIESNIGALHSVTKGKRKSSKGWKLISKENTCQ